MIATDDEVSPRHLFKKKLHQKKVASQQLYNSIQISNIATDDEVIPV